MSTIFIIKIDLCWATEEEKALVIPAKASTAKLPLESISDDDEDDHILEKSIDEDAKLDSAAGAAVLVIPSGASKNATGLRIKSGPMLPDKTAKGDSFKKQVCSLTS